MDPFDAPACRRIRHVDQLAAMPHAQRTGERARELVRDGGKDSGTCASEHIALFRRQQRPDFPRMVREERNQRLARAELRMPQTRGEKAAIRRQAKDGGAIERGDQSV